MEEQTSNTLKDITDRIGWKTAKQILGHQFGITAVGLEPFIERVREASGKDSTVEDYVKNVWHNLILSGDRLVKLYKLEEKSLLQVQSSLTLQKRDSSVFSQSYPLPLTREQLLTADTDLHYMETVTSIVGTHQVDTTIISSKAYYTEIVELDSSHLSDAGLELKASGGVIKCKTRDVTQCFNSIMILPSQGILALTVDLSVLPRSESERQQFLVEQFVKTASGVTLPAPIDLFSLVQEMYEQKDGRISQVAFITADGNTSSLRLKPSQSCLRTDSYHHGGETASPILTKYKLGKLWDLPQGPSQILSVELVLPGKRAMIDKPNSHLYEATIEKSPSIDQIVFVINKMLSALKSVELKSLAKATA